MKSIEVSLISNGKEQRHLINVEHIIYVEECLSYTRIILSNGEKKDIKTDYALLVQKIQDASSK